MNVLIYRPGSLGDGILTLPTFHKIRERYPDSVITLLTNLPVSAKAAPLSEILENSGLVNHVIFYPIGNRWSEVLGRFRQQIIKLSCEILYHLAPKRSLTESFRDYVFFKSCGIRKIYGIPRYPSQLENFTGKYALIYESEAARLLRRAGFDECGDWNRSELWDLKLTHDELTKAKEHLIRHEITQAFWVASVGTKADAKDWTHDNWRLLLTRLKSDFSHIPIFFIGSREESDRCQDLLDLWSQNGVNACGQMNIRESASILSHARLFIGHDSGPMHLAAAVGTPLVAIFAARSAPGRWFPRGYNNRILYHQTDCFNCRLDECALNRKKCILSISVEEVLSAIVWQAKRGYL